MPDIFLGEFDTDITPPHLENPFPGDGSVGVPRGSDISFDLIDGEGSGVDINSVVIKINGVTIFQNGTDSPGWSVSYVLIPMTTGDYTFTIDKDSLFDPGLSVQVDVDASDLSEIPNEMDTYSWSFDVDEGEISSPILRAVARGLPIHLSWTIDPDVIYIQFELRRSTIAFPVSPTEGDLIYEGNDFSFIDTNTQERVLYYYTVFVHRKNEGNNKVYIPYSAEASDSAMPRIIVISTPKELEYVPFRGEFGGNIHVPVEGLTSLIYNVTEGLLYDTIQTRSNNPKRVVCPSSGIVQDAAIDDENGSFISIVSDTKFRFQLYGFSLDESVVIGSRIDGGSPIGVTSGDPVKFVIQKLPDSSYPYRPVRPSYFYIEVERRDGA